MITEFELEVLRFVRDEPRKDYIFICNHFSAVQKIETTMAVLDYLAEENLLVRSDNKYRISGRGYHILTESEQTRDQCAKQEKKTAKSKKQEKIWQVLMLFIGAFLSLIGSLGTTWIQRLIGKP